MKMSPKFRGGLLATAIVIICLLPINIRSVDAGQTQDDSVGVINRKEKEGRPKPRTKIIQAPLLSLQWWLMIRGRDCHPQEFDSKAAFAVDDMVRIGISVNQSGFLYVVLENRPGADGTLIYPDPRINRGSNLVRKNTPVILPGNCPPPESRDSDCPMDVKMAEDCWWSIERAGAKRTGSPDLPRLRSDLLERIKRETVQARDLKTSQTRPQPGAMGTIVSNFTTRVTNTNRRDNEEIVETITLKLQNR
jgi:hypothetical protein